LAIRACARLAARTPYLLLAWLSLGAVPDARSGEPEPRKAVSLMLRPLSLAPDKQLRGTIGT